MDLLHNYDSTDVDMFAWKIGLNTERIKADSNKEKASDFCHIMDQVRHSGRNCMLLFEPLT